MRWFKVYTRALITKDTKKINTLNIFNLKKYPFIMRGYFLFTVIAYKQNAV